MSFLRVKEYYLKAVHSNTYLVSFLAKRVVRRILMEATCHATEDPERVTVALLNILPSDLRGTAKVSRQTLKGHYGNPITMLKTGFEGDDADRVFLHILENLSEDDRRLIALTIDQRMDGSGNLYLRLDKQKAYLGKPSLYDGDDVIRIIISIRGRKPLEVLSRLGLKFGSS